MLRILDVVSKLKNQESLRGIQKETGTHRKVIRQIKELADKEGWLEEATPLMAKIHSRLYESIS